MDIKYKLKKAIMKQVMKKRKAKQVFDEAASDLVTFPENAGVEYNNSYYYAAHAPDGNAFFWRLGQRGGIDGPVAEIWFGFVTKDGDMYMNKNQLYKLHESPLKTKCIEPLKLWELSFDGDMVPVKPGENLVAVPCGDVIKAKFDGVFTSSHSLFEMSRDTHNDAFARGIAAEKWVKGFSDELKNNTQTRIEQVGHVKCTFNVKGKEYKMDCMCLRDQAYGKRYWSFMNHYSWLEGQTEDGRSFNTVMVKYPCVNKVGIETGYHFVDGTYHSLLKVDYPKEYKTRGIAPVSGSVPARFTDNTNAHIAFNVKCYFPYTFTDHLGGYNVFEGVATYMFNGVRAFGIAEFSYNQDRSRIE
jgi:hypothetical protein